MADPSASQADPLTTAQVSQQSFTAVTVELILVFNTSRLWQTWGRGLEKMVTIYSLQGCF